MLNQGETRKTVIEMVGEKRGGVILDIGLCASRMELRLRTPIAGFSDLSFRLCPLEERLPSL
jgi:hypothetical protein